MKISKKAYNWWAGGGETGYYSPYPLQAFALSDAQIFIRWDNVGADSYVLDGSTDNSTWSNLYTGTNLNYTQTGLTASSLRYFRLTATKSGIPNSAYLYANATTLNFTAIAAYNLDGIFNSYSGSSLNIEATNDTPSGTWTNVNAGLNKGITSIKPFLGLGPTFNYNVARWAAGTSFVDAQVLFPAIYTINSTSWPYFDSDSDINLTGDFTISLPEVRMGPTAVQNIFSNTANIFSQLTVSSVNSLTIRINNVDYTLTYPNGPLSTSLWHKLFIQRSGTQCRVGRYVNGVISWGSFVSASANTVTFNRFLASTTPINSRSVENLRGQIWFVGSALSDANCKIIADYNTLQNYTQETENVSLVPIGVGTYSSPDVNGYITDGLMSSYFGTTKRTPRIFTRGNYTLLAINKLSNGADGWAIFNHTTGKLSTMNYFDPESPTYNEIHSNAVFWPYDNKWHRCLVVPFYDVGISNRLLFDRSASKVNLSYWTRLKFLKNFRDKIGVYSGEPNVVVIGDTHFISTQEFLNSNGRAVRLLKSTDNLNSFEVNRIIDSGSNTTWVYTRMPWCGSGGTLYIVVSLYNTSTPNYFNTCIIKSVAGADQGWVWTNISGSFSKDTRNNNPLSASDLTTNCSIISTANSSAQVVGRHCHVWTDNEIFGLCGADDTPDPTTKVGGVNFYYSSGGTVNVKSISVSGHSNLISPGSSDGGFIKQDTSDITGNTFDVYWTEWQTGGWWSVIKIRTTDKGTTWSFVQTISNDLTKRHDLVRGSDNYPYTNGKILLTSIKGNAVYPPTAAGTWLLKDIS